MPNEPRDRTTVTQARAKLDAVILENRKQTAEAGRSAVVVQQLLRTQGASDGRFLQAQSEQVERIRQLEQSRSSVTQAKQALSAALKQWLNQAEPDDLTQLTTDFPLALFPVRLETRFDRQAAALKIRIYPDTILAESHDPLLTQAELDGGQAYWRKAWVGDEVDAWRELLQKTRVPRAAWVVQRTTPTNLAKRPAEKPVFGSIELRSGSWDRATETRLLPDRWIALAYRQDVQVGRAVSQPVQEPLVLGFDPHLPLEEGVDVSGDGLKLDPELAWTVDFSRAEEMGMAIRMPLKQQDLQRGFDQLFVLGVKTSLTPEEGRTALVNLFEGQHFSSGWGFIAHGTPTNNTETTTAPHVPPDPDGQRSFAIERGAELSTTGGDGVRLMQALGLPTDLVAHIEGADRIDQTNAQAMNRAIWPATFGYFLGQMMAPHVSNTVIDTARDYFVENVRSRGPLPALRVRGQPYGILPVISLDRWGSRTDSTAAETELVTLLRQLRPFWQEQVGNVPRIGQTSDPDADLLAILGMDASSREVRVRHLHGPDFQINLLNFLSLDPVKWRQAQLRITRPVMPRIGFPDWDPRILLMNFADNTGLFRYSIVTPDPLSEDTGLESASGFNYIKWIRETSFRELRDQILPGGKKPPNTLLYLTLRHAKLVELRQLVLALQVTLGLAPPSDQFEAELIDVSDETIQRPTIWQRLEQPIPNLTGQVPFGTFLETNSHAPEVRPLRQHQAALQILEELPTAELQRLFPETLDLCAHRLDAWITSLATKRLKSMRQANPSGVYLGAFGWVEDLRPAADTAFHETTLADGRQVRVLEKNGGYMLAPSMAQASTAAVLRNAYLSRSRDQEARYAIDLSSERVRMALSFLDAVRQGQTLGAVLGYQFERGLHDRRLDWFIEPLRRRFPLVANKAEDSGEPSDAVAARSVVDGLALHKSWLKVPKELVLSEPAFFRAGIPPTSAELDGVKNELQRLEDALDAITDLLTAESVYQFMNGNTGGVNTSLDAMAKGIRPPEPAIAQQSISGTVITQRVAIVLGDKAITANGWMDDLTPRAQTEPYLDGWAGQLFGDPRLIKCLVKVMPPEDSVPQVVTMADLELRPIDILALAQGASEGPEPLSELDQRVAEVALARAQPGARVDQIIYSRPELERAIPDKFQTFPEILELARSINRLLAVARPLQPKDLVPPEATALLPKDDPFMNEVVERVTQANNTLDQLRVVLGEAINANDPVRLRKTLRSASLYGIQGAYHPDDVADGETITLLERAGIVLAEIERRIAEAKSASTPETKVKAIFGSAFSFLPRFLPAQVDELRQALNAGGGLTNQAPEAKQWLYQSARVRPSLALWRKVDLLTGVIGSSPGTIRVAQLPHRPPVHWVALPFKNNSKPVAGTLSIVLHCFASPQPESPWVGLLLDEWSEIIPNKEQMAGLAFHYDAPSTEPPQTILIAVPPDDSPTWTFANLTATLRETFDLAKIRAVDGELLGVLGQLLPAIYVSSNAANDTVSTDFRGALFTEKKET